MDALNSVNIIRDLLKIELSAPDYLDKDITIWKLPNGKLHRVHGPAIVYSNGSSKWFYNDRLHREDGPAIELEDGVKFWFIHGQELSEEEFKKLTK